MQAEMGEAPLRTHYTCCKEWGHGVPLLSCASPAAAQSRCPREGGREALLAVSAPSSRTCRRCLCPKPTGTCPAFCPAPARPATAPVMAPGHPLPHHRRHRLSPGGLCSRRMVQALLRASAVCSVVSPTTAPLGSPGPKSRSVSAVKPPFGSALSARPSQSSSGAYVQAGTQPWRHGLCPPRLLSALIGRLLTALTWDGMEHPSSAGLHTRPRGCKDQ